LNGVKPHYFFDYFMDSRYFLILNMEVTSNSTTLDHKSRGLTAVDLKSTASLDELLGLSCRTRSGIQKFQLSHSLDSGFRRNDRSFRDNEKLASPEGEGFQPSPKGTLYH